MYHFCVQVELILTPYNPGTVVQLLKLSNCVRQINAVGFKVKY